MLLVSSHASLPEPFLAPGIGDYAYPELGCPPNEQIVRIAADIARQEGREIATPDDARALLSLPAKSKPV